MGFINSYKQLEKLCNEIYGDNHGISSYIDDMSKHTFASHYVSSWDNDLKQLKHYRWVRNQLVHDPNCMEENMCEYGDAEWLDTFRSRIMSGNDPLTLYRKAQNTQVTPKQTKPPKYIYPEYKRSASKPIGCLTCLAVGLLIVTMVALIITIL
jgi:hypothetical protein